MCVTTFNLFRCPFGSSYPISLFLIEEETEVQSGNMTCKPVSDGARTGRKVSLGINSSLFLIHPL